MQSKEQLEQVRIRIVEEKETLDDRIARLEAFISAENEAFIDLSKEQKALSGLQLQVMKMYSTVLAQRLSSWEGR
jgi:uncharacterized protein YdcH (DUF465 family)